MSHIKTLFFFQLQYFVKTIVVWSAVLFGVMSMYMAFFFYHAGNGSGKI